MPNLTVRDPDRIARYERAGWRAHYDRRRLALLRLTVSLCRAQFRIPFPLSLAEEALRRYCRAIGQVRTARQGVATGKPRQANDYRFVTQWRVRATPEEVVDVLADATDLPRWWPSVYLHTRQRTPGDEHGGGQIVELHTKGWLPYTIRWRFRALESDYPRRITIAAEGDLTGRGAWTFTPDGEWTDIRYDWEIRGDKPLFRTLSFLLKPAFAANHRWAMARGAESLALELRRRRAITDAERATIPAPPGPTTASPFPFLVLAGGLLALCILAARRRARAVAR